MTCESAAHRGCAGIGRPLHPLEVKSNKNQTEEGYWIDYTLYVVQQTRRKPLTLQIHQSPCYATQHIEVVLELVANRIP